MPNCRTRTSADSRGIADSVVLLSYIHCFYSRLDVRASISGGSCHQPSQAKEVIGRGGSISHGNGVHMEVSSPAAAAASSLPFELLVILSFLEFVPVDDGCEAGRTGLPSGVGLKVHWRNPKGKPGGFFDHDPAFDPVSCDPDGVSVRCGIVDETTPYYLAVSPDFNGCADQRVPVWGIKSARTCCDRVCPGHDGDGICCRETAPRAGISGHRILAFRCVPH